MLKKHELSTPTSCLNKAAVDEPIFVLRGKDAIAAQTVRLWASMADGVHEPVRIAEATLLAEQMDKWRAREVPAAEASDPAPTAKILLCVASYCRSPALSGSTYCAHHQPSYPVYPA